MAESPYALKRSVSQSELWRLKSPVLQRLDIELTERCNNACQHCYINLPADDAEAKSRELSTDAWREVLRQAADLGVLTVRLTGGEPLLREDFVDIYMSARRLGLRVLIMTNARLITSELADLFARVPPREAVEITVYGMHQATYEAVSRAPGSYAEFRRGVELLADRQVPFIVKGARLPANRSEKAEFETWAQSLPGNQDPPSYAMFFVLRGRRDSPARNRQIAKLRISSEEGMDVLTAKADEYRSGQTEFCSKFMHAPGEHLFNCGAGTTVCVDAYGRLQPCMMLRDPALTYDLLHGSLREALTQVFPKLRDVRATNPEYLDRCARCFIHGLCEQCPAKSWAEHGTLDTPVEYFCQIAHAEARYLGLLAEGERAWEVLDGLQRVQKMQTGVGQ